VIACRLVARSVRKMKRRRPRFSRTQSRHRVIKTAATGPKNVAPTMAHVSVLIPHKSPGIAVGCMAGKILELLCPRLAIGPASFRRALIALGCLFGVGQEQTATCYLGPQGFALSGLDTLDHRDLFETPDGHQSVVASVHEKRRKPEGRHDTLGASRQRPTHGTPSQNPQHPETSPRRRAGPIPKLRRRPDFATVMHA
jgi:hypothetical protein